jgi:hypothetical protein
MSPDGGDKPDGELAAAIEEHFWSFDGFRRHFTANALGVQGSGWSVLAWEPLGQRLVLEQAELMFGLSSLSGILLDELAAVTGRSRSEVVHGVHLRYLGPGPGPSR